MIMEEFIKNFAEQFDDTDLAVFTTETKFRDLEEWSSLIGLAVMNMIAKKYSVKITPAELRATNTIADIYNLIQSKE
ncbi:MAG TPA: acyl carrier protein [Bacteroidales bacterium]|nr:acyl carrier protein [Bacteroidales bacterium]